MPKTPDLYILPRPAERLPEYAKAPARQNLAERLVASFDLSEAAATTIANAVVDPSEVRKSGGSDMDSPNVESIPVFGGTLLGIRTPVWSPWCFRILAIPAPCLFAAILLQWNPARPGRIPASGRSRNRSWLTTPSLL